MNANALEALRRHHAQGGRSIAMVGWRVPTEPMLAGGFRPFQFIPAVGAETPVADDLLGTEVTVEERALFELIASGALGGVDLLVIGQPYLGLSQALVEMRRLGLLPAGVPPLYFFETLIERSVANRPFAVDRVRDLARRIEAANAPLARNADALRAAIVQTNQLRDATQALLERRAAQRQPGSLIVDAIAAGGWQDSQAQSSYLAAVCGDASAANAAPNALVIGSSVIADGGFHRLLESNGLHVVGEDSICGSCHSFGRIAAEGEPIEAIGNWYFHNQPLQRAGPIDVRFAWLAERIARGDVDCVVFYAQNPVWGWDVPAMRSMLESRSIPSLLVVEDVRLPAGRAATQAAVAEFAASIVQRGNR